MEGADEERLLIQYLPQQHEGSKHTSDGTVDINKQPALKRTTGNWRACFFILGAEFSEYLAFSGIAKNLVTYLTSELHESNVDAARHVSTWVGSCFFTPLIGAFLADTYWGRYWTIVISLSVYIVGMLILSVSASLPLLMDSSNNTGIHRTVVYIGLYVVALGTGGIKPCTSALGAEQFDGADPVEAMSKASFFNWYYLLLNIGSLVSATVLVWVQNNIGWGVGFSIPMMLMAFGIAVFVSGRRVYRYKKVAGSPLTRVAQVVVAAVRNYKLVLPDDSSALHELHSPAEEHGKIEHTCQFRFFDKAAIIVPPSAGDKGAAPMNPWRLCTVSQVEELKMLLRMFPIWASTVLFFTVTAQMSSTLIEQGMVMDTRVGAFTVPPASLATFDIISVILCIPVYDGVLVQVARRVTGRDRGLSQLQRIGVGLALSVVAMAYAALVEARRLAVVVVAAGGPMKNGRSPAAPMSIMWQAPAFALIGVAEVFTSVGLIEFFFDHSPGGMKSLGNALALLAMATGNYLNSPVIGAVVAATARGGSPGWIPDNLNEGHLDYFFWFMAALSAMNLLYFVHIAQNKRI